MSAARERVASQNTKKAHPTAAQDSVLLNCLIRIFGASGIVDTAGREKRRDEAFVEADQTENKGFHVGLWRMAYRLWQMANGLSLITLHAIPIRYLPLAIGYRLFAICHFCIKPFSASITLRHSALTSGARAIKTISHPPMMSDSFSLRRMASLRRRLARLRATAPPTLLLAVMPRRVSFRSLGQTVKTTSG